MAILYVAYNAKSKDRDGLVNGWATIRNCEEPRSTEDVTSLCKKIADVEETITNVIPVWWKVLGD